MSSRRPVLTGSDAERARRVALEVGSRLADPERVERAHARTVRALARAGIPAADWSTIRLSVLLENVPRTLMRFVFVVSASPGPEQIFGSSVSLLL